MTEFQPQDATAPQATQGRSPEPRPYRGMPDLQGKPFNPYESYGEQAPAEAAPPVQPPAPAPVAAPVAQQPQPAQQPYAQPYAQPNTQPYAQPHSQPYAQVPWQPGTGQAPAWGPPPAPANTQAPKKRKAWPWVLGIVGGLVVIGGAGFAVLYGVTGALNADQNENYIGGPIAEGDSPTLGDKVVVSDDGNVAFEIGADWVDAGDYMDVSDLTADLPEGAESMGAYFTADPITASVPPTLVMVLEGAPPQQIGPVDLDFAHDSAAAEMTVVADAEGLDSTTKGPTPLTTALGLDGLQTVMSMDVDGTPVHMTLYTFVRSQRVVWVQIATYTGSEDVATVSLVTDSLRIDK